MPTKPFYSLAETENKLGLGEEQIRQLARDGKLREFRSQGQVHFKADDVERVAMEMGLSTGDSAPAAGMDGAREAVFMPARTDAVTGLDLGASPQAGPELDADGSGLAAVTTGGDLSTSDVLTDISASGLAELSTEAEGKGPAPVPLPPLSAGLAGASQSLSGVGQNKIPPVLSESVGFAHSEELGLSESIGFSMPADSQVENKARSGVEAINDDARISGSQTGLGSADLGLSESVGFSTGTNEDSDSDSDADRAAVRRSTPATPPITQASESTAPHAEEGELGLSESIGFSQLDESDENPARRGPAAFAVKGGDAPASDLDLPEIHGDLGIGMSKEFDAGLSQDVETENLTMAATPPRAKSSTEDISLGVSDEVVPGVGSRVGKGSPAKPPETSSIELSLEEADKPVKKSKGDTVITSAGISVFDDEDLEASADPLAKTTVAPSVDEQQLSLEGVGSGSGLLDLTREADDTSLDAELLDEIYPGSQQGMAITAHSSGHGSALMEAPSGTTSGVGFGQVSEYGGPAQIVVEYVEEVERKDPYEIAFTIALIIATLVMCVLGLMSAGLVTGMVPSLLSGLHNAQYASSTLNFLMVAVICTVVGMGVGLLLGHQKRKREVMAQKMAAMAAQRTAAAAEGEAAPAA